MHCLHLFGSVCQTLSCQINAGHPKKSKGRTGMMMQLIQILKFISSYKWLYFFNQRIHKIPCFVRCRFDACSGNMHLAIQIGFELPPAVAAVNYAGQPPSG
jgi:hypothetical protein